MNIETFLKHWQLTENPFVAEEARDDQVYKRIMSTAVAHPDFEKLFGIPSQPSTAVVFGERGSGKTALRLLMEDRFKEYNQKNPDAKTWVVRHDEYNHMVDRLVSGAEQEARGFASIRLEDHMDKIMSLCITELVDCVTRPESFPDGKHIVKGLRRLPRQQRLDVLYLAALYDQSSLSTPVERWKKLCKRLKLGKYVTPSVALWTSLGAAIVTGITYAILFGFQQVRQDWMLLPAAIAPLLMALSGYVGFSETWSNRKRAKHIIAELRCMDHPPAILRTALGTFKQSDLASLPTPTPGDQDCRYELLKRLMRVLKGLDYVSMTVLVDRVDEASRINGDAKKMKSLLWPVFTNKFLQLDSFGIKMLLPIELGYELKREDADFYSRARLDKSNLIERLEWTGVTLFDICSKRLESVYGGDTTPPTLADLFEEDVRTQDVIEALDQMKQPRDAFKFFYDLLQQHCQHTTDADPVFKIPRLTLDQTRRRQSQRVSDLSRGYSAS